MAFTQDLVTSRNNYADGNTRIGKKDRMWYDSITNTLRIGDGVTPGGIVVTAGGMASGGISNITDNGDGTLTLTYGEGETFVTGDLTGPTGATGATGAKGDTGDPGVGISNIADNGDGTLTLTYASGSTTTTSNLRGPQGNQGNQGDKGDKGDKGDTGERGNNGNDGDSAYDIAVTEGFSGTVAEWLASLVGATGSTGATGADGADGAGITNITDNGNGTLTLTYGDGGTVTTGDLTGPQGATGDTGPQGATGSQGVPGGLRFTYNSATSGTPSSGQFILVRSNASFLSTTTSLRISQYDAGGTDLLSLYDDWDDSTSTNKALLTIQSASNNEQVAQFFITSTVSNSFQYSIFTVSFKGGDATFTNGAEYIINVSITGNKGDAGTNGADGVDGVGISTATINESGNLIITLTDASVIDAGYLSGQGTVSDPYSWSIAADDSTLRDILSGESIKILGASGITTASDSEGNITITGPNLSNYVTLDGEQTLTNKTLTSPTITDGVFQDSFTIGEQVFIEHGVNGFSVNEDFDIVGASNFTGYHYTSGAGRTGVAFTLARTAQFTNGFGVHGTSADNEFVIGSEFGNTDFVFKKSIGMPFDVSGGTTLFTIKNDGALLFSDGTTQTTAFTGTGSITFTGNSISSDDSSAIDIVPVVNLQSDVYVGGDLFPNTDLGGNLGSQERQWKSLYVSNNTIFIGGFSVSVVGGKISVSDPSNPETPPSSLATESFVQQAVNELIGAAPEALNTLQELAAALGNDENFATTILDAVSASTNAVRYDINNQGLTAQQKQNARTNIDAVSDADVYAAAIVMG